MILVYSKNSRLPPLPDLYQECVATHSSVRRFLRKSFRSSQWSKTFASKNTLAAFMTRFSRHSLRSVIVQGRPFLPLCESAPRGIKLKPLPLHQLEKQLRNGAILFRRLPFQPHGQIFRHPDDHILQHEFMITRNHQRTSTGSDSATTRRARFLLAHVLKHDRLQRPAQAD